MEPDWSDPRLAAKRYLRVYRENKGPLIAEVMRQGDLTEAEAVAVILMNDVGYAAQTLFWFVEERQRRPWWVRWWRRVRP